MSESPPTDSNKSPVVDKVAVASKHPGVFMETSELEAETGTKLPPNLPKKKPVITKDDHACGTPSNQEDKEAHSGPAYNTKLRRKKVQSRSKRKRFDRSKVTGYAHKIQSV